MSWFYDADETTSLLHLTKAVQHFVASLAAWMNLKLNDQSNSLIFLPL